MSFARLAALALLCCAVLAVEGTLDGGPCSGKDGRGQDPAESAIHPSNIVQPVRKVPGEHASASRMRRVLGRKVITGG